MTESQGSLTATTPDMDALFGPPNPLEQERMVEALLFASAEPLSCAAMAKRLPAGCDVDAAVNSLAARYEGRGVTLRRVGDAWAIRTASDLGFLLQQDIVEPRKLSRAAIETLAIVAYHQPVTRAEIEEVRGVAVSKGTLDLLMELEWVRVGRRRLSPGRPVTFLTTQGFLDHFGLETPRDLPGLKELREAGFTDGGAETPPLPDSPEQPAFFPE